MRLYFPRQRDETFAGRPPRRSSAGKAPRPDPSGSKQNLCRFAGSGGSVLRIGICPEDLIGQYRELWKIEKAFRISKTDLKVRPVFHRLQRRIEAHICISFVAHKVYKEFERQLSQRKSYITIERAIECLKTIFGVTILHPPSGLEKWMLHTNNEDQIPLLKYYEVDLGLV